MMQLKLDRNSMASGSAAVPVFLMVGFLLLWHSASLAAGFREVEAQGMHFGLWYPSDTPVKLQRLGPFDTEMAKDAPVRAGRHKVVLFSHGNGGRYRNHHLTAQILAEAGFFVIAPQHEADYLVGGRKTAQALDHRYLELARALKFVRESPEFKDHISEGPVHGVGYSLGAATILLASGAGFESKRAERHCQANGRVDNEFCEDPGFLNRLIQSFRHEIDLRLTTDPFRNAPIITGNAVAIAPIYQGLDLGASLAIAELTVIAFTEDRIAKPKFHAVPLYEVARLKVPAKLETIAGHHYAFISPFPNWLTEKENIPVAKDPEGFDRLTFLKAVNAMVVESLTGG